MCTARWSRETDPFVGRRDLVDGLRRDRAATVDGSPRIVWVSGPPGVGKTALVRRFTDEACAHVRWLGADAAEQRLRLEMARQALRLLDPDTAGSVAADEDELTVGAALLRALGTPSDPLVLVLDDLQWADRPSLTALRFALRRLEHESVLVVLISRPLVDGFDEATRRFLDDPHEVRRLELGGLNPTEIAELAEAVAAGPLDPSDAVRLADHTDGHPLHAVALLRELGADRIASAGRVLPAPRTFAQVVSDRLGALPARTQAFLRAASVLGLKFAPSTAAAIAGLDDPGPALNDALGARLLERRGPDRAEFAHPLIRAAIYNDLPLPDVRRLHGAAAGITEGLASLWHRHDAAAGTDDELARALETAAALQRAADNVAEAGELLVAAAEHSTAQSDRSRRTIMAAEIFADSGLVERAHTLRPAVEACPADPRRDLVLGLMDVSAGRFDAAGRRFEAALAVTDSQGKDSADDVRSRLLASLGLVRWAGGDFQAAYDAVDAALRGDVGRAAARSCYIRIVSMEVLGNLAGPDDALIPPSLDISDRLIIEGMVRRYKDDAGGAVTALEEAVRQNRHGRRSELFVISLGILAQALFRVGRWDDAALQAELAVSLARDTDAQAEMLTAHAIAAEIQAARGRFDASAGHLDQARRFAAVYRGWPTRTRLAMVSAFCAIARGDGPALQAAVRSLLSGPGRSHVAARPSWPWRTLIAEAQLTAGAVEAAASTIAQLTEAVHALGRPCAVPDLARLTGWLAEARGRERDALRAYTLDEATAQTAQYPLAVARLDQARGELLVRRRQRAAGIASLQAARATFAALGAVPFLARCEAALAAVGTAAGTSAHRSLDLSPRQEAVALLVAEGMTNQEIAAELYVSVKAVEYHLGQIYARTGLASRHELRRRMRANTAPDRPRRPALRTAATAPLGRDSTR